MKTQSHGLGSGLKFLATGFRILWLPGIRRFVWIPLLINIVIFAGLGWIAFEQFERLLESFSLLERFSDWWIVSALTTVLRWIMALVLIFIFTYAFTLLANLIGAPFNSFLSERVESHLTGRQEFEAFSLPLLLKTAPSAIGSEVRKLLYLVTRLIPLLILHLIPGVNLFAPFLLFLFGAWMYAIEYVDHPMGNHGYHFTDVRRTLRRHRSVAFGFGLPVALLSMLPVINLLAMPWGVSAATVLYVEAIDDGNSLEPAR